MPSEITCSCGQRLAVRAENVGKRVKCPACGAEFVVGETQAETVPAPTPSVDPPPAPQQAGPDAPPPVAADMPTAVTPKLQKPDLPPCWVELSADGAALDTSVDITAVMQRFIDTLARRLKKKHNVLVGPAPDGQEPSIRVRVVGMRDGTWFLRFLLGFLAGAARFEVDGSVRSAGEDTPFEFSCRGPGMWLNTNLQCMQNGATGAAVKIAKLL